MALVLVLVVLAVVVLIVAFPLRPGAVQRVVSARAAQRDELEARKEAKYREIRDAELDFRMGKLSRADWRATDRGLRAEAIELLRALDALEGREGAEATPDVERIG